MSDRIWRVLIIDDNENMARDALRELNDAFEDDFALKIQSTIENDFDRGYELVANGTCDIVVLDVRKDRTAGNPEDRTQGKRVYSEIREVRFLPVIFWTALPGEVADYEMEPLVRVFAKEDLDKVPDAVRAAISSGVAEITWDIEHHVADVMRQYLWDELAPHWQEDTDGDPKQLAYVLITRVASSLRARDIPGLVERPSHRYVYPPVSEALESGQVLLRRGGSGEEEDEWYVVLTPACDLRQNKAEFVLLARARLLEKHKRYIEWIQGSMSKTKWSDLQQLLSGALLRYVYLPAFRDIPDLVVDFEETVAVPKSDIEPYKPKVSLSSPYSEALLAKHSQYLGRIGTPDLNMAELKARLTALGSDKELACSGSRSSQRPRAAGPRILDGLYTAWRHARQMVTMIMSSPYVPDLGAAREDMPRFSTIPPCLSSACCAERHKSAGSNARHVDRRVASPSVA